MSKVYCVAHALILLSTTFQVEGVLAVHEFHVWQLAGNRIIASAHIRCQNLRDYMLIAEKVKSFFHNEGIHSTTIQPEFVEVRDLVGRMACNGMHVFRWCRNRGRNCE